MTSELEQTVTSDEKPLSEVTSPPPLPQSTRFPWPLVAFFLVLGLALFTITGWLLWRKLAPAPVAGVTSTNAFVLEVAYTGFYQITADELDLTATDWQVNNMQLTHQGEVVPYRLQAESLIFYGLAPTSPYTTRRPYVLSLGKAGTEMIAAAATMPASPSLTTITRTLRLEENHNYQGQARTNWLGDIWFWETIGVEAILEKNLNLPLVTPTQPALLTLTLWGSTYSDQVDLDHDLDVRLNDQPLGTIRWDGQQYFTATLPIPANTLVTGDNSLVLDNKVAGATFIDIMYLDWLELAYQTPPTAVNDHILMEPVNGTVELSGFTEAPLLFDIAEPSAPAQITTEVIDRGRVPLTLTSTMRLAAIGPTAFLSPAEIRGLRVSDWHNPANQADLLILTTDALAPALQPLKETRDSQGIHTLIVPVAEIYDEFGAGEVGPDSLRTFLQYAHQNWTAPLPRYLLLVGDVSTDFRNYLGQTPPDVVPTTLIPVTFSGETVSDTRLADLNNDGVPDLALGRWPISDPDVVANLVARTLAYEQSSPSSFSIFTADGTEEQFSYFADNLISQNNFTEASVIKLYGQPTTALTTAWNEGAWLVTYNGHGSLDMWGKEQVLTLEALENLRPQAHPPIVLQFTCLTGLFAHPTTPSISEIMLSHENGPVLIIAATSLTLPNNQEPFAQSLIHALQNPDNLRMGDALLEAQNAVNISSAPWLQEIIDTFGLLGDPSTVIIRP